MARRSFGRFDPNKHPRGAGGRFTSTPDDPKASKSRTRRRSSAPSGRGNASKYRKVAKQVARLAKEAKTEQEIQQARRDLMGVMSHAQRQRMVAHIVAKAKAQPKPEPKPEPTPAPVSPEPTPTPASPKPKQTVTATTAEAPRQSQDNVLDGVPKYRLNPKTKKPKYPRVPTVRPPVEQTAFEVTDKGIEIWKGQPELGKHTGGFKVKQEKDYEYKVTADGKEFTLNKNKMMITFEGERVHGVPSLHSRLRDLDDDVLFKRIAEYAAHVENSTRRSIKPPAIEWSSKYHGSIDKAYVTVNGKAGQYGGAEIHHVDQWTRRRFDEVTNRYKQGKITLDQAKEEMKELLVYTEEKNADGSTFKGYRIKIHDKPEDRDLVVLAAGTHNFTNKVMYYASHPKGIHPDTGIETEFGIPNTGKWGRETWFNGWNARFWTEYYRREVYVMRQEVNRRMSKGLIDKETAQRYLDEGIEATRKTYLYQKEQKRLNPAIRAAIKADFEGEQKGLIK